MRAKAWALWLGLMLVVLPCWASDPSGPEGDAFWSNLKGRFKDPVMIHAQKLTIKRSEQEAVYEEGVLLTQRQYRLHCDRLEVIWDRETKTIVQVRAKGNVVMEFSDGKAVAEQANFDVASKRVTLTGSPELVRDGQRVKGDRIIYDLRERKGTVLSGPGTRVQTRWKPERGK